MTLRLKSTISLRRRIKLRNFINDVSALFFLNNLNKLAEIYNTDKFKPHRYTMRYKTHFKSYRWRRVRLFEIGVGGYDSPVFGGNSLRMWKAYFPFSRIVSLDIYDKSALQESRIKIYTGSQTDFSVLDKVIRENGNPDIIIDDGSHISQHVITSFNYLFPLLKSKGIYAIEDTHTSFSAKFNGDEENIFNPEITVNYFRKYCLSLNYKFTNNKLIPDSIEKEIESVHFYENLIVIHKK